MQSYPFLSPYQPPTPLSLLPITKYGCSPMDQKSNPDPTPILAQISQHLHHQSPRIKPLVIMTCGISGSGKSTLSHTILATYPKPFIRLSIDQYIYTHHGRYGTNYPASKHEQYHAEAAAAIMQELPQLLQQTENVVLDLSLWSRAARDEYKGIVEANGGEWMLVYFELVAADVKGRLWERIQERKKRRRRTEQRKGAVIDADADAAFEVTEEILDAYIKGFEVPCGEGEVVVSVS